MVAVAAELPPVHRGGHGLLQQEGSAGGDVPGGQDVSASSKGVHDLEAVPGAGEDRVGVVVDTKAGGDAKAELGNKV